MPSYSFYIRKADHPNPDGTTDLHVHVYFNQGHSRRLIGRYRLPSLTPVFLNEPELSGTEIQVLRRWLAQPEQLRKLNSCLRDTVFDIHRLARAIPEFGEVMTDQDGDTYINIRIPVSRRIRGARRQ